MYVPTIENALVPMVVEQVITRRTFFRYLLAPFARTRHLLTGEVEDNMANLIVAQMLFLEAENPDKDIHLYINFTGRFSDCWYGDLRHHAVYYKTRRGDLTVWVKRAFDGCVLTECWCQR